MKRAMVAVVLTMLSLPVRAADKSLELLVGPVIPLTKLDNSANGGGTDYIASTGFSIGGRFMNRVKPNFSLGGEIQSLMPGDQNSSSFIAHANTKSSFSSMLFLAEAKLAGESGPIRPFAIAGLGFHSTHVTATTTLAPGFVWTDTGTRETRTVVDSTQTKFAGTVIGGAEIPIDDRFSLGLSAAFYYLAKGTYDGVSGSISAISFLGSAAYRF